MAFSVSFIVTLMVVRHSSLHAHITADWDLDGVQRFHTCPAPRVSGLGTMLALAAAAVTAWIRDPEFMGYPFLLLMLYVMPIFIASFIEDMTKRVNPRERLLATVATTLAVIYFLNIKIVRIDIHFIDVALAFPIISIMITTTVVVSLANPINIIGGLDGLASTVAMMMSVPLAYVAFHMGDTLVLMTAFAMVRVILDSLVWSFPIGHVFLGDGGAYVIGFVPAKCSILLASRNISVSARCPVLMVIYPIFETLFSIYRRRVLGGVPAGYPDGVHLYTLVYQRVIRWVMDSKDEWYRLQRSSLASPYLWLLSLLAVLPTTLFWNNELALLGFVVVFTFSYIWLYWRIMRSQSPHWLIVKKYHRVKEYHEH